MLRGKMKKILSVMVSVFVLLAMAVPVFAEMSDISGHWASGVIQKWIDYGIIDGYPDGTFKPENSITRAEFIKIVSEMFGFQEKMENVFLDVSPNAWYADVVSKAGAAGIIDTKSSKYFRPNDPISRQEAALVLYRAFKLKVSDRDAADKFADAGLIADWSKDAVSALAEKGYVEGRDGNKFAPTANITRAEALKMIDNIAYELKNAAGEYTGKFEGNLVVSAADVTLKDATIEGDLYLAQGIGEGSVTLDGVTVKGRTVVMGGGENSIILNNTSLQGLIIIKQDGKIRVVAKGDTSVASVVINSGAKLQTEELTGEGFGEVEIIEVPAGESIVLDGDFEKVVVAAADIEINVTGGKVENFEIAPEAEGAEIQIAGSATINTLTAKAAVEVKGTGKITTANIEAENVTIEPKPAKVVLGENVESAKIGGETVTESTPTVIIPGGVLPSPTVNVTGIKVKYSTDGGATWVYTDTCAPGGAINNLQNGNGDWRVKAIHVTADQSGDMVLKSLKDKNGVSVDVPSLLKVEKPLPEVEIGALVGSSYSSVSLNTLRSIFGDEVVITGTIIANNGATKDVTFTLKLGGTATAEQNEWIEFSAGSNSGEVIATIKSGKETTLLKNIHVYQILSAAGSIPYSVTIDGTEILTPGKTNSQIAADISGSIWETGTLEDLFDHLQGKEIIIKKTADGPSYKLIIQ